MFGPHVLVECYKCNDIEKLKSEKFVKEFLLRLVDICKMTVIMSPEPHKFQGDTPDQDGVTGIVVIAESHISIHTYPEHRSFALDIFSCKDFEYYDAIQEILREFQPMKMSFNIIQRGEYFPRTETKLKSISENQLVNVN